MPWIKEVEMATPANDPQTSRLLSGQQFPIFEALDAKIATSLKKIIAQT